MWKHQALFDKKYPLVPAWLLHPVSWYLGVLMYNRWIRVSWCSQQNWTRNAWVMAKTRMLISWHITLPNIHILQWNQHYLISTIHFYYFPIYTYTYRPKARLNCPCGALKPLATHNLAMFWRMSIIFCTEHQEVIIYRFRMRHPRCQANFPILIFWESFGRKWAWPPKRLRLKSLVKKSAHWVELCVNSYLVIVLIDPIIVTLQSSNNTKSFVQPETSHYYIIKWLRSKIVI